MPVPTSGSKLLSGRDRMRLVFDYTYINNPEKLGTGNYCSKEGDSVNGVLCQAKDVMTPAAQKVINETFRNVQIFVADLLWVDRVTGPFTLSDRSGPVSQTQTNGNTDLYVTLYPKPFGADSNTLASAAAVSFDETTSRPVQGLTNVNLAVLPAEPSDFSTRGDRQFFEVVFHELCHILGIGSDLFQYWINPVTGKSWGKDKVPLCSYTEYGKTFTFLYTAKLHALMRRRWGVAQFNTCPAGVEIEDFGEEGTIGSHWKLRTFMTEIMVGTSLGYSRISDVTLTALADTGWYDVPRLYLYEETLEWGDYRSIRGKTQKDFENFSFGPPATSWPDNYLIKTAEEMPGAGDSYSHQGCSFDHRAIGIVEATKRETCTDQNNQCQYPTFYDANELGYYGKPLFDYLLIYQPASDGICFHQDTVDARHRSMCAKIDGIGTCQEMWCEKDTLYVYIRNSSYKCLRADQQIPIEDVGTLTCPEGPNVVCSILPDLSEDEKEPRKPLNPGVAAALGIITISIVAAVFILPILHAKGLICQNKPKPNKGEPDAWVEAEPEFEADPEPEYEPKA